MSCPATDIGGPAAGCTAAAERLAPVHEAVDAFAAEIGLNKMQEIRKTNDSAQDNTHSNPDLGEIINDDIQHFAYLDEIKLLREKAENEGTTSQAVTIIEWSHDKLQPSDRMTKAVFTTKLRDRL